MSVFNLLTDEDKENIIKYIDCFAPLSDRSDIPHLDELPNVLKEWDTQKSKTLEKMFGEHLILSRPYTYAMADDGVIQEIEDAISTEGEPYWAMKSWLRQTVCGANGDFPHEGIHLASDLFYPEVLAHNAYEGEAIKLDLPGCSFKVNKGMKPMRILNKIVAEYGDDRAHQLYEDFRNWHSMLLNQIYMDGTLSLSIHPLDFMTMSDNEGSWSSCMRWMGDGSDSGDPGDYRAGTVECMNSPYIVVAYLQNPKKKMEFWRDWRDDKKYYWNKKKWRELFIVQNGVISEIKGYPFQDENLTNTALMWLKELAQENLGWEFDDVEINAATEYVVDNKHYLFKFRTSDYMYNDFGTLKKHRARVNIRDLMNRAENYDDVKVTEFTLNKMPNEYNIIFDLKYGGKMTCMCCGDYIPFYDNHTNGVLCHNCENTQYCPCCGEYYEGEGYFISSFEDPICYGCFEYDCEQDDLSGDREYNNSLIDIHFAVGFEPDGTPIFHDNIIRTLDTNTFENYSYQKLFTKQPIEYYQTPRHNWDIPNYYVTLDMVKDINWFEEVFGLEDDELTLSDEELE